MTIVCWLVLSFSLHWTLLQTVAWTGMVISYSHGSSFKEALAKTFDGKHPCALCKAIKKGRAEEQKREPPATSILKLEVAVVWQTVDFQFAGEYQLIPACDLSASSRSTAPQKPPPRPALHEGQV